MKREYCRTKSIIVRVTEQEHEVITQAASSSRSISDYIRGALLAKVIREHPKLALRIPH